MRFEVIFINLQTNLTTPNYKNMKNYTIIILVLLSFFSCKKIDKLTQFNLDMETEVTIPAGIPVNIPYDIPSPPITTNSESSFEDNNTSKDLIESAVLKEMKLSVANPTNGNFDFLKNIEIYLSADGLSEVKIAWKLNHQDDGKTVLSLDTSNDDLQEYIKKDKINIRVKTTTDKVLSQDYDIKIEYTFFIDADILGV